MLCAIDSGPRITTKETALGDPEVVVEGATTKRKMGLGNTMCHVRHGWFWEEKYKFGNSFWFLPPSRSHGQWVGNNSADQNSSASRLLALMLKQSPETVLVKHGYSEGNVSDIPDRTYNRHDGK